MKVQVQLKICKETVKDVGSTCAVKYIYSTVKVQYGKGTVRKIGGDYISNKTHFEFMLIKHTLSCNQSLRRKKKRITVF